MKQRVMTVGKLNKYIKTIFDNDPILRSVLVEGEISNFKLHSSGHAYFSLKDSDGRIQCVMFRNVAMHAPSLKDGDQVVLRGNVSIYEKNGQYQLYVSHCEKKGLGDLYVEFEKMKEAWRAKGWFDADKKKPLPFMPHRIGIVTSPTGAAIRDMISVITRRFPHVEIQLLPVRVQGDQAAGEITKAINEFNRLNEVEVIIVGRGGGSIEELWAFNETPVVESIHDSKLPVISAVGHETDFTISDFVADLRAPTPSAAGELVVPSKAEEVKRLFQMKKRLSADATTKLIRQRDRLQRLKKSYFFARPEMLFAQNVQELDYMRTAMVKGIYQLLEKEKTRVMEMGLKLESYNPQAILKRGYAAVKDEKGKYVTGPEALSLGDAVDLVFATGQAQATITGKGSGDHEESDL